MAIVTVDASPNRLHLESIPIVDMRFISQSELNSLSLCSDEAFDLRRCDNIVIPKIDRSVFNESAGSRKQTYSRLPLTQVKPETTSIGRRSRRSGHLPVAAAAVPPKPTQDSSVDDDPETKENKRIVGCLRKLFSKNGSKTLIGGEGEGSLDLNSSGIVVADGEGMVMKRCGKRKDRMSSNGVNRVMEIVNRNGVAVDIDGLASMVDPFLPELKRRTVGLETEAELLEFLRGLEGKWGSRRMKRRVVDASDFGDVLPRGWKLSLGLKRKDGRVWLFCRRYISPSGEQFQSCKEVSSYLHSLFRPQHAHPSNCLNSNENTDGVYTWASENIAGQKRDDGTGMDDLSSHSPSPIAIAYPSAEKLEVTQISDVLECRQCDLSFDDKDEYLQHMLSSHKKRRRRRVGSSVGDGVIIKDGKYVCQFCHKMFLEKHSYNGHVGIHVRNYVRSFEASPGALPVERLLEPPSAMQTPSTLSNVDASDDVAIGSIPSAHDEMDDASPRGELDAGSFLENAITIGNKEMEGGSSHTKLDTGSIAETSPYNQVNVCSPQCELDAGSISGNSSIGQESERKSGSSHILDTGSNPETSTDNFKCSLKAASPDDERNTVLSARQTSVKPNELNAGSTNGKLDSTFTPEAYTAQSNHGLNVGCYKVHNPGVTKINESLTNGFSYNQESKYKMIDDTLEKSPEVNEEICVEANSLLNSEMDLFNNGGNRTCESCDNNNSVIAFSPCEHRPDLEQEAAMESCSGKEKISFLEASSRDAFSIGVKESEPDIANEPVNNDLQLGLGSSHAGLEPDVVTEIAKGIAEDTLQNSVVDMPVQSVHSSDCYSNLQIFSHKGKNAFHSMNQKLENISSFEELRFDDVEPSQFAFETAQESSHLPGPMDFTAYDADLVDTSLQLGFDTVAPAMDNKQQLTTICVWCGVEFSIEAFNPELQSDSVGFMCPTCKSKISSQLNVLDTGLLNSDQF